MGQLSDTKPVSAAVIVGGSGAIAQALAAKWATDPALSVYVLSRSEIELSGARTMVTDYSDSSLARIATDIASTGISLSRMVVTNGMLSNDSVRPERKVGDLSADNFEAIMSINALLPMRAIAAFWALIRQSEMPRIAVLSARVGSLGDNKLGGWYSYRASKAALNMMMKCAAIEVRRSNKQAKMIVYHPGTVDSSLSKPFQRSVPEGKLFTPDFSAAQLIDILNQAKADGELAYLDWAGETIPW
jgi:NAD(P)-dependent dehydrogenase (short-subunit alcohol dehydrogenase family)